ncbi:hypothetical protein GGX14DRAFT_657598 [Mycena pura]|uniref:Protein kinase domain-containing protein n=1 Tax=Mycena pura TaxID=153505 RepID=A0AAD6YM07_9AGAR|nr:hypothetical protein GGX14DRAFT_657598 [Mycena pura]
MSPPSQSLESFFYVCSNQNGTTRSITFPCEASGTEDRILEVANSLAFICVTGSRGKGEVYATAIRTEGSDSAVIYLAENDGVPDSTVKYLRSVLEQLTAISRSQPDGRDRSLGLDDVIRLADEQELGTTILRHTFPKFLNSLTKRDAVWDTRVAAIRDQLAESPDELKSFARIEKGLSVIYNGATLYKAHTDDTTLKGVYESISMLEGFIRRRTSSDKLSVLLQKLDRTAVHPWSAKSDFVDNDLELDVDSITAFLTWNSSAGFSMTRFIYRIIAVNIHIRRLLRLAVSHTYKSLFAKEPSIHCCPRAEISIYVEPAALTDHLQLDGLIPRYDSGAKVKGPLHAELSVFTALLHDFCEGRSAPYWAIGVSKLMCVGCHTLIAKAFPRVLQEHPIGLKPFAVQGTHGKMYYPWVAPDLKFATTILYCDLDHKIRECCKEILVNALKEYAEQRRLSDRSGTSDKKVSETQSTNVAFHFLPASPGRRVSTAHRIWNDRPESERGMTPLALLYHPFGKFQDISKGIAAYGVDSEDFPAVSALLHLFRVASLHQLGYSPLFTYSFTPPLPEFSEGMKDEVRLTGRRLSRLRPTPFGRSTAVYAGVLDGRSVVIKLSFISEGREWRERIVIEALHALSVEQPTGPTYAPKLLGSFAAVGYDRPKSFECLTKSKRKAVDLEDVPALVIRHHEIMVFDSSTDGRKLTELSAAEFLTMAKQLFEAILGAYSRRVLHRDVSINNIRATSRLVLYDWEIGRLVAESPLDPQGTVAGTLDTMSVASLNNNPPLPHDGIESAVYVLLKVLTQSFVPPENQKGNWEEILEDYHWDNPDIRLRTLSDIRMAMWNGHLSDDSLIDETLHILALAGHEARAKLIVALLSLSLPAKREPVKHAPVAHWWSPKLTRIDGSDYERVLSSLEKLVEEAIRAVDSVDADDLVKGWIQKPAAN